MYPGPLGGCAIRNSSNWNPAAMCINVISHKFLQKTLGSAKNVDQFWCFLLLLKFSLKSFLVFFINIFSAIYGEIFENIFEIRSEIFLVICLEIGS